MPCASVRRLQPGQVTWSSTHLRPAQYCSTGSRLVRVSPGMAKRLQPLVDRRGMAGVHDFGDAGVARTEHGFAAPADADIERGVSRFRFSPGVQAILRLTYHMVYATRSADARCRCCAHNSSGTTSDKLSTPVFVKAARA